MTVSDSKPPTPRPAARWLVPAWLALDLVLVAVIFIAGSRWGAEFERTWHARGNTAQYYQHYFEPAVMIACGRGFVVAVQRDEVPGLQAFLNQQADGFDCSQIPAHLSIRSTALPQQAWYYLIRTVGFTWSLVGVSWSGLAPLFGALYGGVLVLAFGLFRLAMGRPLALAGTFAFGVSSLHLVNLPHLRDYAKAPFVLALILLMAWAVRGDLQRRRIFALAAAAGGVLGVGYGFRTDLLASIPPVLITFGLFLPGGIRNNLRFRAQAVAVVLAAFLAVSWPVVTYVAGQGGCQWHVMLLGLSSYFDDDLAIEPASYDWGPYSDDYVHTAVGSFYRRGARSDNGPAFCGPEYDRLTARYMTSIATTVPGDLATRAVAALTGVLDLPAAISKPPFEGDQRPMYQMRADYLPSLQGWAPLLIIPLLIGLAAVDLRFALWAFAMLLWFGGMTMLQFDRRHHFHFEWMGWLVFGAISSAIGRAVVGLALRLAGRGRPAPEQRACSGWKGSLALAAGMALVAGTVVAVRAMQARGMRDTVSDIHRTTSEPVATIDSADGTGRALRPVLPGRADGQPDPRFWVEYLRIDVEPGACGPDGAVLVRYAPPLADSTRAWTIRPAQASILTPVFQSFQDILEPAPGCVRAVYRAPNLAALPGWMYVEVPAAPRELRAVQSYRGPQLIHDLADLARFAKESPGGFARWVSDLYGDVRVPARQRPRVFTFPGGRHVTVAEMNRRLQSVHRAAFTHRSIAAVQEGSTWRIVDGAEGPFTYLLAARAPDVQPGWRLLVAGSLESGGLTVGLLKADRWLDQVHVLRTGLFAVVIEPSADGPLDIVIANNQVEGAKPTRASIDTVSWIEPSTGPPAPKSPTP